MILIIGPMPSSTAESMTTKNIGFYTNEFINF